MVTFYLDSNNNLVASGDIILKSGIEAIKQDVKTLLLMFATEYPFDLKQGINWYNLLNENNLNSIKTEITKRLLQDTRINNVRNMELKNNSGKLQITATLYTSEGVFNV